jgi:mono/diheme cytochrome c family protein
MTLRPRCLLASLASLAIALAAVACAEEENPNTSTRLRDGGTSNSGIGLSTAFTNKCARCHGEQGQGSGKYPPLPNGKDESAYVALVRAGRDEMPAFTTVEITDADLKADFAVLTKQPR